MFERSFPVAPQPGPRRPAGRSLAHLLPVVAFVVLLGSVAGGCAEQVPTATWQTVPGQAAAPANAAMPDGMSSADPMAVAAWNARPGFIENAAAGTQAGYAYALQHPDILRYIPCYCGCAGAGHKSNLDCYITAHAAGSPIVFDEHASYCDVCIRITEMAKQRTAQGQSLSLVRQAVDQTFGGGGTPGTPTELPPL